MAATATVSEHPEPVIERASATDRAFLAMDADQVPEQLAVILVLEQAGGLDVQRVRKLIAGRLPAIPRLRQRLVRVPFGCGGPVWADDPRFDIGRHVRAVRCPEPGDERALLDAAIPLITTRLPLTAPLWAATLVTGLALGRATRTAAAATKAVGPQWETQIRYAVTTAGHRKPAIATARTNPQAVVTQRNPPASQASYSA